MNPKRILIVFAKAPNPGHVKTRMIPLLSEQGAAQLQSRLVLHTVNNLANRGDWQTQLWCAPNIRHPLFQELAVTHKIQLHQQIQGDLGEKMFFAFESCLSRADQAVIVGTDCPLLTPSHVEATFSQLDGGYDAVITPAEDGGYVMLGLSVIDWDVFNLQEWGNSEVLSNTLLACESMGWRYKKMPSLWDVDTPEDYLRLQQVELLSEALETT